MAILQKAGKNLIYVQVFTQDCLRCLLVLVPKLQISICVLNEYIGAHAHGYIWDCVCRAPESSADCTPQFCSHYLLTTWIQMSREVLSVPSGGLHHSEEPASPKKVPVTLRDNPQALDAVSRCHRDKTPAGSCGSERVSGFSVVPVLTQPVLPQPPLALGLVLVQELWRRQSWLLELVARLVVLPRVPLALAGGDHGDFVRSRAVILALQLDALGAGLVVDAPPIVVAAPATPQLPAVGAADPVLKHLSWETLTSAHQLLDGVDAGAVAVGDVLSRPQLSAPDLASLCGKKRGLLESGCCTGC